MSLSEPLRAQSTGPLPLARQACERIHRCASGQHAHLEETHSLLSPFAHQPQATFSSHLLFFFFSQAGLHGKAHRSGAGRSGAGQGPRRLQRRAGAGAAPRHRRAEHGHVLARRRDVPVLHEAPQLVRQRQVARAGRLPQQAAQLRRCKARACARGVQARRTQAAIVGDSRRSCGGRRDAGRLRQAWTQRWRP